jgi:hypothetical protein
MYAATRAIATPRAHRCRAQKKHRPGFDEVLESVVAVLLLRLEVVPDAVVDAAGEAGRSPAYFCLPPLSIMVPLLWFAAIFASVPAPVTDGKMLRWRTQAG